MSEAKYNNNSLTKSIKNTLLYKLSYLVFVNRVIRRFVTNLIAKYETILYILLQSHSISQRKFNILSFL